MKIYTKKGDKGTTSLIGGVKVSKGNLRIHAYGTVDELNSFIGLLRDSITDGHSGSILRTIQNKLFTIGSHLASDPVKSKMKLPEISEQDIILMEQEIDKMNEILPELMHFILPGGNIVASYCHLARTVCRRAERLAVELADEDFVEPLILKYLNRLSDYLFVLARKISFDSGSQEEKWIAE